MTVIKGLKRESWSTTVNGDNDLCLSGKFHGNYFRTLNGGVNNSS